MGEIKQITHQQWDSDFLGFNTAKIVYSENTDLLAMLAELKPKYKLCYFFTNKEHPKLEEAGGKLEDIKVTFSFDLSIKDIEKKVEEIVEYPYEELHEDILELAYQSGEYSRFRLDVNFAENVFRDMYKSWISKSISKEIADFVYVYMENNQVLGMVTLSCKNDVAQIGLIAVNPNLRGKNIGSKLISKTLNTAKKAGCSHLEVSTQKQNHLACNFYLKNGFHVEKETYIYHLWL